MKRRVLWWQIAGMIFVVALGLLALVLVPGIGSGEIRGAKRWIDLGFITFQPSEVAKISFIIFASSVLSRSAEKVKSFKGLIPVLFPTIFASAKFLTNIIIKYKINKPIPKNLLPIITFTIPQGIKKAPEPKTGNKSRNAIIKEIKIQFLTLKTKSPKDSSAKVINIRIIYPPIIFKIDSLKIPFIFKIFSAVF